MGVTVTVLGLAGSVALLLWGVHMVSTGVQRAFGARLHAFLAGALRNRFTAFLAGIGVTAVLQSSTATGLMVTGFAAGGLVGLVPALAVMLGANVGTTLIVQVLSFDVAQVAPVMILLGYLLFRRATAGLRDFGRVLIGLGLMLLALGQFITLLKPYEEMPDLRLLLETIATMPLLDVLLGAALTWAAHSSVAIVLVVMSFADQGTIPPAAAFALVLGANLGTAINPVLEGATGHDPAARRLPVGNLLTRVVGVALALAALPWLSELVVAFEADKGRAVADFHTAFNIVVALVFFPLLAPYAALLRRLMPARADQGDPGRPIYLDPAVRETPALALGCAAREALRMSDVLEAMLVGLRETLDRADRRQIGETRQIDDVLDKLNAAIKSYVTSLDMDGFGKDDEERAREILAFATNIEQAGDIVDRNLLNIASKLSKRGLAFPEEGRGEIRQLIDHLIANCRSAASLLMTRDDRTARSLVKDKEEFRALQTASMDHHFIRLRSHHEGTAETSSLHLDTLSDLAIVNGHLLAAAAYPVLESRGELLSSRLRDG